MRCQIRQLPGLPLGHAAVETHAYPGLEDIRRRIHFDGRRKRDADFGSFGGMLDCLPDMLWRFRKHGFAATAAVQLPHSAEEKFDIISQFRHGSHGGAGCLDGVFPVDGNGRGDSQNGIHLGPVHPIHELPGVGRKCLHIPPLSFGVQGVESQGRFPRSADTGDDRDPVQVDIQVEIFQVVLSGAANGDG